MSRIWDAEYSTSQVASKIAFFKFIKFWTFGYFQQKVLSIQYLSQYIPYLSNKPHFFIGLQDREKFVIDDAQPSGL